MFRAQGKFLTDKEFDDEWADFERSVDSNVVVADVDCMLWGQICVEQKISTFPSLVLYEGDQRVAVYNNENEMTKANFESFVDHFMDPLASYQCELILKILFYFKNT